MYLPATGTLAIAAGLTTGTIDDKPRFSISDVTKKEGNALIIGSVPTRSPLDDLVRAEGLLARS